MWSYFQTSERTLDAPDLVDDYYLNLLDWGSSNVLAIALGNTVYLWDATDGATSELVTVDDENGPVTSVKWAPDGRHIAIGLTNSDIQLWDSTANRQVCYLCLSSSLIIWIFNLWRIISCLIVTFFAAKKLERWPPITGWISWLEQSYFDHWRNGWSDHQQRCKSKITYSWNLQRAPSRSLWVKMVCFRPTVSKWGKR